MHSRFVMRCDRNYIACSIRGCNPRCGRCAWMLSRHRLRPISQREHFVENVGLGQDNSEQTSRIPSEVVFEPLTRTIGILSHSFS